MEAIPYNVTSTFNITPPVVSRNWTGLTNFGTNLVALNNGHDTLYTIDPNTGAVLSALAIQGGNYGGVAIDNGIILVGDASTSRIYTIDSVTGLQTSSVVATDFGGGLAFFNNRLFYSNEVSTTFEIDPLTGGILNSFNSNAPHLNDMAFDGTSLYAVNSQDGNPEDLIQVFNPNTGAVLESFFAPTRQVRGMAFIGSTLYTVDPGQRNMVSVLSQSSTPPPDPNTLPPPSSNPIPEPSTMLLFGTGLAALAAWRYRKNVKV